MQTAARPRILFVDDDQTILDGIASSLWRQRKHWDMTFVCGGEAALEVLRTRRFEAIVTDMRMPQIDGEALLSSAAVEHPGTIRVILSGQTDRFVVRRTTALAHQFLSKPCTAAELRECLERMLGLTGTLEDRARELVCAVGELPIAATSLAQLEAMFASSSAVDEAELVRCVEADIGLAAKVLHVASAGFVAQRAPVSTIDRALTLIGVDELRAFIAAMKVHPSTPHLDWLLEHVIATGKLLACATNEQHAFTCGILHALGKLALSSRFGSEYRELLARVESDPTLHLCDLEHERFGISHDTIAAYLVDLWGVSPQISRVLRHHCRPTEGDDDLTVALHVACSMTHGTARIDDAALAREPRIAVWRERLAQHVTPAAISEPEAPPEATR